MNHVERFRAVMDCRPVDRLPRWEWATWWDKTIARWHTEGLPTDLRDPFEISQHFGLDPYKQFWFPTVRPSPGVPIAGAVENMDDYRRIRPLLYPDPADVLDAMSAWAQRQQRGEVVVWTTFEGFYWMPRTFMGVEKLSYAFYDQPELIHAINRDLTDFTVGILRRLPRHCVPTFTTIAEDMSYNHGPLLGEAAFMEFLAPYYREVMPELQSLGVLPIVDTDGDVTEMVPWLESVGVRGVLPLERQAGVDAAELRRRFPRLCMIGHFDKMTMPRGQAAMRAEFERLAPTMRQGGFIPSVDHQTPPGVSLEQYRQYLALLEEYTRMR